jgi:hypothetical protein
LEEFNRELPHALLAAEKTAFNLAAEEIDKMLSDSAKNQELSSANIAYLTSSEEFAEYLKSIGMSITEFTNTAYS